MDSAFSREIRKNRIGKDCSSNGRANMGQTSSLFRLAVWKPANPIRRFMVLSTKDVPFDYQLHEQIYAWEPDGVDIWGSLRESARMTEARAALIEAFDPNKPVKERGLDQLRKAIEVLGKILQEKDATGWSECEEFVKMGEDQINIRANTILLLYRHLDWIWRVFAHVPGASVTVR